MPKKKQKLCFVLMPFSKELKEVYTYGIKTACEQAGFRPFRVDEEKGVFNINRKIVEYIYESDAIIADLTTKNSNVFYEMGVAHAIANKTIMIVQDTKDLPFDIRNYRCIIYTQSVEGLKNLEKQIVECLESIQDWRKKPSNPVQDFKPKGAFIPKSEFEKLKKEFNQKSDLLKKSVPRSELEAMQKLLLDKEKALSESVKSTELTSLQKEREQLQLDNDILKKEIQQFRIQTAKQKLKTDEAPLRSKPIDNLSEDAVKNMLQEKDFFDSSWNNNGKGLKHEYEEIDSHGQKLVRDHATGLTWQKSGSNTVNYKKAGDYINQLNNENYGGCNTWRLPTLEETMSLMESEKHGDLYIDPKFDEKQWLIWTADKESASRAWVDIFLIGSCYDLPVGFSHFVRAVC